MCIILQLRVYWLVGRYLTYRLKVPGAIGFRPLPIECPRRWRLPPTLKVRIQVVQATKAGSGVPASTIRSRQLAITQCFLSYRPHKFSHCTGTCPLPTLLDCPVPEFLVDADQRLNILGGLFHEMPLVLILSEKPRQRKRFTTDVLTCSPEY